MNRAIFRIWVVVLLLAGSVVLAAAGAEPAATNKVVVPSAPGTNATISVEVRPPPSVWLTFGLDRVELLQQRPFADIPLWQFVSSLIYIFLAFYISKLLDFVVRERLQKWAARTENRFDDIIISLLRGPVRVVSFVVLLHIGMEVYSWPPALERYFSLALKIIVASSIMYVLLKGVDASIGIWRERTTTPENEQFSRQLLPLISKTIKVFLVIVVVLVTSQNLGFNVTGLIASLSIGGLAIGLAAQDTLANLFGAVAVLMDKPFKVGDRIQLDNVDGTVEVIGFRSTRVRTLDGHLVTVPNKTMGNATITNVTLRPTMKSVFNLGLTYDTPPDKVLRAVEIVREVFRKHSETSDLLVTFNKFTDSTLNLEVVHWWKGTDYKNFLALLQSSNLEIKSRFDAEGIEFAFPTQTIHLKSGGPEAMAEPDQPAPNEPAR